MQRETADIMWRRSINRRGRVSAKSEPVWLSGSELRRCVKVEVAVPGSPSPIVLMVSVDVKQH